MSKRCYYEVLGVSRGASADEIKKGADTAVDPPVVVTHAPTSEKAAAESTTKAGEDTTTAATSTSPPPPTPTTGLPPGAEGDEDDGKVLSPFQRSQRRAGSA